MKGAMSDIEQRDDTATDGVGDWAGNPYASRMVEYTPYAVALGMKFVSSSAGTDILAPGVLTALIDHACGLAIMAGLGFEAAPATLDLRIDHMRPAAPRASVTCSAHVYRATRTIAFLRAEAWMSRQMTPSPQLRPPSRSIAGA
jgi:acyl-coenzyme A thioesterase PaaI-like protein